MRVISYNIHRGTDKNKKKTLFQIVKYLKKQKSDVICLQEVLYSQYRRMKLYLGMNGVFAENVKSQKYGICIFSKNKIIEKNHVFLTSKREQRGVLHIKICDKSRNSDVKYLNIINTHLGLNKNERFIQIDEILNFIDSIDREIEKNTCNCNNISANEYNPANIIICGDFNEKNLSLSNFNDISVKLNKDHQPTFIKSRIDYCFASKDLNAVSYVVDDVYMSDHFPIKIDFA